jgi:glutamine synthetase
MEILEKFDELGLKVGFGFEFEFYILDGDAKPIQQELFLDAIQVFFNQNQFSVAVYKEVSQGQVEIASRFSFDLINMLNSWLMLFEKLKNFFNQHSLQCNHLAKPFENSAGNGLHINISLHNNQTNENLFGCKDFSDSQYFDKDFYHRDIANSLLAYSIGGVLKGVGDDVDSDVLFNRSTIKRIKNPDRNSPRNISWGYNNRTTLLRIPEGLPNTKRLENRLFSSEDDILFIVIRNLEWMYYGITHKILPQRCTFGLAFDEQYDLQDLVNN